MFTYDSMVHFEMMDIYEYLKDIYRVLKLYKGMTMDISGDVKSIIAFPSTSSPYHLLFQQSNTIQILIMRPVNTERRGAAYSRNKGLDMALGKYIIFLDGDDLFDEIQFIPWGCIEVCKITYLHI